MSDLPDDVVLNPDPGNWFNYDPPPIPLRPGRYEPSGYPNQYRWLESDPVADLEREVSEFLGLGRDPDEPTIVEGK